MKVLWVVIASIFICGCSVYKGWFGSDMPVITKISIEGVIGPDGKVVDTALMYSREEKVTGSSSRSVSSTRNAHIGALIAWSPEFNAAFISSGGKGCIQPATYAKSNSGSVEVPASLIKQGIDSGNLTGDFSQALDKLITVTDQSTFLSMGLFGLCQMHANGGLTDAQLTQLTAILFEKAASMKAAIQASISSSLASSQISVGTASSVAAIIVP